MKELLKQILKGEIKIISEIATVDSVDKSSHTIAVTTVLDKAIIPDVRLGATKGAIPDVVQYPTVGSYVVITYLEGMEDEAYASLFSSVDEVLFHEGINGGLIKVSELKAQLDKNNSIINAFKDVLGTPINEPGNGAPSAFQAALSAALSALPVGDFSNLENEKVKH